MDEETELEVIKAPAPNSSCTRLYRCPSTIVLIQKKIRKIIPCGTLLNCIIFIVYLDRYLYVQNTVFVLKNDKGELWHLLKRLGVLIITAHSEYNSQLLLFFLFVYYLRLSVDYDYN